jgi:hypothetical protein
VLVLDNVVFLGSTTAQAMGVRLDQPIPPDSVELGFGLSRDQEALFEWMNRPENRGSVVASDDQTVGYLLTTYTPLRAWLSHNMNTPGNLQRLDELQKFYAKGEIPPAWRDRPMLIVFHDATVWRQRVAGFAPAPVEPAYTNDSYTVVRVRPAATSH